MKKFSRILICLTMPFVLMAEKDKKEPGITRQQAEEILNELRQIRQLLEKQAGQLQGPQKVKLNTQGVPMIGNQGAPVTIVEFTDYQCPFCQRFHLTTFRELKKDYIDTGKVRFYSRDLPLDSLHPNATRAAEAGRCAADQGQFWALRDLMSANPDKLDLDNLLADAQTLKLDEKAFRACLVGEKYKTAVQNDVMEALRAGAEGTPAFVVGRSTSDGVDGELLVGAQPLAEFVKVMAKLDAAR